MAKVVLKNLYKDYAGTAALTDVNLCIENLEMLVLVGFVGTGKSVLLKTICGIEKPSSGEVLIGDKQNINKLKHDNTAMVFTKSSLFNNKTVFYNLAYGLKLRKIEKIEIDKKVNDVAEVLKISDILYKRVKKLPHNLKQLIAIGRAVVRYPDVLLLDEPFIENAKSALVLMQALIEKFPVTCIYSTHNFNDALYLNKKTAVIREGILYQQGLPCKIEDKPFDLDIAKLVQYNINVFDCTAKQGLISFLDYKFESAKLKNVVKDKEYYLVIMPDDISQKSSNNAVKLCGTVKIFEDAYILSAGGGKFFIKQSKIIDTNKGIEFFIDAEKIHLFDKDTKINILHKERV